MYWKHGDTLLFCFPILLFTDRYLDIEESFASVLERSITASSRGEHQIPSHQPKSTDCSISIVCTHSPRKSLSKASSQLTKPKPPTWKKRRRKTPYTPSIGLEPSKEKPRSLVTSVLRIGSERISINKQTAERAIYQFLMPPMCALKQS